MLCNDDFEVIAKQNTERVKYTFAAASIAGHIVSDRTGTAVASRGVNTSM